MRTRLVSFLAVAFALSLHQSDVLAVKVTIQYRAQDPVCKAAAEIAGRIPGSDFSGGQWRSAYGTVDWEDDSYPTVTAEGREQRVTYSRVALDLDNDGHQDVVILYTGMMSSVDWDHIYVVPPDTFTSASRADAVGKMLHTAPQLNPDNSVHFTSGIAGVPVEIQIWKHGPMNYLVLKEHFFAKGRRNLPASLFVGRLASHKPVKSSLGGSPRLVLEQICRMSSP